MRDASRQGMPTPAEILRQLEETSRVLTPIAMAWHIVLAAAVLAVLGRWRPSQRTALVALAAPAASVALAASEYGSAFNVLSFAILTALLGMAAWRASAAPVSRGPAWATVIGAAALAYGWIYPHFVEGGPLLAVIAAPIGLVPCPTLAVIAGFALIGGGFGSRGAVATVATWSAFYAVFGIARLGVVLDAGLAAAAVALAALLITQTVSASRHRDLRPSVRSATAR